MGSGEFSRHYVAIELASVSRVVSQDDDTVPRAWTADDKVGGPGVQPPLPGEAQRAGLQAPPCSPCQLVVYPALDLPALVVQSEHIGEEQAVVPGGGNE